MRPNVKRTYYFHAHANSLGGFIEKPFQKHIPPQAAGSLPPVGGHISARTGPFAFEETVSCRGGYTHVSGRQGPEVEGSGSVLVTSVVEGLNILEVVTAERVVAQISIEIAKDTQTISFAGSRFEGLLIDGYDPGVEFNPSLRGFAGDKKDGKVSLEPALFHKTGRQQADKLDGNTKGVKNPFPWLTERNGWMRTSQKKGDDGLALCSIVERLKNEMPARSFGHVVEIPHFGRLFLGEILFSSGLIQLSMVRAELGCNVSGGVNVGAAAVGQHSVPP